MADDYEPLYHVPQQSRRDKLRVVGSQNHLLEGCSTTLVSLSDPSLIASSDLLSCAALQQQSTHLCDKGSAKEEGGLMMMMDFRGYSSPSFSSCSAANAAHQPIMFMNQQATPVQLNPNTTSSIIQDNIIDSSSPYYYTPQDLSSRFLDHPSFHTGVGESVVYKPGPLTEAAHAAARGGVGGGGQGLLSLSLSSSPHHAPHNNRSNLPLELNLPTYNSSSLLSTTNDLTGSSVHLDPFTGYASSILKGSRFLKPAQQLLDELFDIGLKGIYGEVRLVSSADDSALITGDSWESINGSELLDNDPALTCSDGTGISRRKSRLISLLHEVYRKYKQYYQQMQAVVASFECVARLSSNAAPLALKSMSKHFRSLKNAITDQLQFETQSHHAPIINGSDKIPHGFGNPGRGLHCQRSLQVEQQPVLRPQRGLPERAVSVLRAWLFEHFLHPYPTDNDKMMLAKQTGLSRNQVSNWFINARVRLWKPMVEEIHMLETQQSQRTTQRKEHGMNYRNNDNTRGDNSLGCENPSSSSAMAPELPSKRSRNKRDETGVGDDDDDLPPPIHLPRDSLNHQHDMGIIGTSTPAAGGSNNGVSLTLGLHHQNIGAGLSKKPFPVNATRRFGLDADHGEEYYAAVGGFG